MNTYVSRLSQDKTCELSTSKSKTAGWTLFDLLLTIVGIVVISWCIHSQHQSKQSHTSLSNQQSDNNLEIGLERRQQITEFQQQAHDLFSYGFAKALDANKQGLLDNSGSSGLIATSSEVNSLNIQSLYASRPSSAEEALKGISSYTAVVTIYWTGPDNSDGYSEFELVSKVQTGTTVLIRLLKTQSYAN